MLRLLKLWCIFGQAYMLIEGIWRGWTHISMFVVGGLCGLIVGMLNQIPTKLKIWQQCLIGTVAILFVEFVSGCILNLWLHLGIWDYSTLPFNVCGQVCLLYGILWFLLCPFAIWFDDQERYKLFGEGKPYPIYENYVELFTNK